MSDENRLQAVEQQGIDFYGDVIQAVRMANGEIYVAVKPMCEYIGVNWAGQYTRIKNDPILSKHIHSVEFISTELDRSSNRPRAMEMIGLRLEYVNGWLFKIDSRRVKEEAREKLLTYQERCYLVLFNAFNNTTTGRLIELYQKQGRDLEWIQERLNGITVRDALVAEWKARGVNTRQEYAVLTNEIYDGAFGLTHVEYMELKQLEAKHHLRDHMSLEELAVTIVGEVTTRAVARRDDAHGLDENREAARQGGQAAKETRVAMERQIGASIITDDNFLPKPAERQPKLIE